MSNSSLRTLVAATLHVIEKEGCFIPSAKNGAGASTHTKVLAEIKDGKLPVLDPDFFRLADEIILFFKDLPNKEIYKEIMKKDDSALYQSCIDIASQDDVMPANIVFVVQMPNLFGKLRPKKQAPMIAIESAEVTPPDSFMGKREVPGRFFVKLVRVGVYDKENLGNVFEVRDRNNNIGLFYERAERLKGQLHLGDCFSIYATPTRHLEVDKQKQTTFRSVEIINNTGPGRGAVDPLQDSTGLFVEA